MHISVLFHCLSPWAGAIGALLGLIGAVLMATNVWLTRKQAIEATFSRLGSTDKKEMLNDPLVQGLLAQSLRTKIGICLLALSFAFQLWAAWPPVLT